MNVNCACEFTAPNLSPVSGAFHRAHREHHLRRFPNTDQETFANLNKLVDAFERAEKLADEAIARAKERMEKLVGADAKACVEQAIERAHADVDSIMRLALQLTKCDPGDAIAYLCSAIATIAANHPQSDALIQVAIEAMGLARRMLGDRTKAGAKRAEREELLS